MADTAVAIGQRLAAARAKAGLTQAAVAELIERDANTVARYERGELVPPLPVLQALCRALSVTADSLLGLPPLRERKT